MDCVMFHDSQVSPVRPNDANTTLRKKSKIIADLNSLFSYISFMLASMALFYKAVNIKNKGNQCVKKNHHAVSPNEPVSKELLMRMTFRSQLVLVEQHNHI